MANSTRRPSGPVVRSHSPSGRFYSSPSSNSFASSTSAFSSGSSSFFQNRSASPTRVNLIGSSPSPSLSSSVRFSFDNRSISPSRSISVIPRGNNQASKKQLQAPRRMCMCSPTSHPGSFRCSLHKNSNNSHSATASYPSNRLNARRSAMTNSLVRIGTVEGGDLVRRALSALIRPSSHQQRRRTSFQPTLSRLSVMTKADDLWFLKLRYVDDFHKCSGSAEPTTVAENQIPASRRLKMSGRTVFIFRLPKEILNWIVDSHVSVYTYRWEYINVISCCHLMANEAASSFQTKFDHLKTRKRNLDQLKPSIRWKNSVNYLNDLKICYLRVLSFRLCCWSPYPYSSSIREAPLHSIIFLHSVSSGLRFDVFRWLHLFSILEFPCFYFMFSVSVPSS